MKLSDALKQIETRISKSEGGVVTMTPEDLVKYLGEQVALADSEGDAGKPRRDAAKAVLEAAKAAEATGATTFDVQVFVAPAAKESAEKADPILAQLAALAEQVKGLIKPADAAKPDGEKPAVEPVGKAAGDANGDADENKDEGAENVNKANEGQSAFRWPSDINGG